jgi:hypothetical protein
MIGKGFAATGFPSTHFFMGGSLRSVRDLCGDPLVVAEDGLCFIKEPLRLLLILFCFAAEFQSLKVRNQITESFNLCRLRVDYCMSLLYFTRQI